MKIFVAIKKFLNDRGFTVAKYSNTLHFFINFIGVILLTHVMGLTYYLSGSIMLAISAGKEVYDTTKPGGTFSMPDMAWNITGIATGILFSL
jgi:hypothetical protein